MENIPIGRYKSKRDRTRDDILVAAQILLKKYNVSDIKIRQITEIAGLVHSSFYNYYSDVDELISDLGSLLGATHVSEMTKIVSVNDGPAIRFARITRQTLRIVLQEPFFGRLMFDCLPIDRLVTELRLSLIRDIQEGASLGIFEVPDIDVAVSLTSGAIMGLALDLHRGSFPPSKIDDATLRLLVGLGLAPSEAARLALEPFDAPRPPELPLRWLSLKRAPLQPPDA